MDAAGAPVCSRPVQCFGAARWRASSVVGRAAARCLGLGARWEQLRGRLRETRALANVCGLAECACALAQQSALVSWLAHVNLRLSTGSFARSLARSFAATRIRSSPVGSVRIGSVQFGSVRLNSVRFGTVRPNSPKFAKVRSRAFAPPHNKLSSPTSNIHSTPERKSTSKR